MTDNAREDRVAPRTAQQVEFRLGSFVHQMHPTKTLPEKEALQLHALLTEYRAAVVAEAASLDSDELRKLLDEAELTATQTFHLGHSSEKWWQGAVATVEWLRVALLSAGDKAPR